MAFKRFPGNKFLCTQLCKCYIRSGRIDDALKEYANFTICADNFKPDVYFEKIQYSGFPYMTMWYYLSEQNFAKCLESCIGILDVILLIKNFETHIGIKKLAPKIISF